MKVFAGSGSSAEDGLEADFLFPSLDSAGPATSDWAVHGLLLVLPCSVVVLCSQLKILGLDGSFQICPAAVAVVTAVVEDDFPALEDVSCIFLPLLAFFASDPPLNLCPNHLLLLRSQKSGCFIF